MSIQYGAEKMRFARRASKKITQTHAHNINTLSLGVVFLMCIFGNCICLASIVVILYVFVVSYVYLL